MPTDDIPHKLVRLLLELIASGELPELAVGGAWVKLDHLLQARPALKEVALEADICGLAVAGLRALGSASDYVVSLVSSLAACACEMSCVSRDDRSARCCGCRASHAATRATLALLTPTGSSYSLVKRNGQTWRPSLRRGCSTSA